jgi:hypothetical protein
MKVILSESLINIGYDMLTGAGILPDDTLMIRFDDDVKEVQIVNPTGDVLRSQKYPPQAETSSTGVGNAPSGTKATLNEYLVTLGQALLEETAAQKTEALQVCFDHDREEVQIINAAGEVLASEKYPWEVTG